MNTRLKNQAHPPKGYFHAVRFYQYKDRFGSHETIVLDLRKRHTILGGIPTPFSSRLASQVIKPRADESFAAAAIRTARDNLRVISD